MYSDAVMTVRRLEDQFGILAARLLQSASPALFAAAPRCVRGRSVESARPGARDDDQMSMFA